jgi:hypothetical protein
MKIKTNPTPTRPAIRRGSQRVLAERRRDGLHGLGLELDGQGRC